MFTYAKGLLLGLSLFGALGPQNTFLIKQASLRNFTLLSALTCFICDLILIVGSVLGLHTLLEKSILVQHILVIAGSCFLVMYGLCSLYSSYINTTQKIVETTLVKNKLSIVLLSLSFSLLNPHAIIDILIIVGGNSALYVGQKYQFLLGVLTASAAWVFILVFLAYYFSKFLAKRKVMCYINIISGCLMIVLGINLALTQLS